MERNAFKWLPCALAGLAAASPALGQLGCDNCALDNAKCEPTNWEAEVDPEGKKGWEALLEKYTYVPDRRPGYIINLGGMTVTSKNPHGVAPWWLDCNDDGVLDQPNSSDVCWGDVIAGGDSGYGNGTSNGRADSVDQLVWMIDNALNAGFTRIMIMYPAGLSDPFVPSSAYWSLPEWKQTAISDPYSGLREHIDSIHAWDASIEFSVYLSIMVDDKNPDPCEIELSPRLPDYTDPDEMQVVLQNFKPWIDAGMDRIWSDFVSGPDVFWNCGVPGYCPEGIFHVMSLQMSSDYYGNVEFGYESWAVTMPNCTGVTCSTGGTGTWDGQDIKPAALVRTKGAFIELDSMFICGMTFDPLGTWDSDWTTYAGDIEYNVILQGIPPCTPQTPPLPDDCRCHDWLTDMRSLEVFGEFREHGVYPWYMINFAYESGYNDQIEFMNRVYDFGVIECPIDFNLDGIINSTDVGEYINQWTRYENCGVTFYEGDFDNDDDVDDDDMDLFLAAWFNNVCDPIDLGLSRPLPPPCP